VCCISGCDGRLADDEENWARKSRGDSSASLLDENEVLCDSSGRRVRGVLSGAGEGESGERSCALVGVGSSDDRRRLLDLGSTADIRLVGVMLDTGEGEWRDGDGSDCRLFTRATRDCHGEQIFPAKASALQYCDKMRGIVSPSICRPASQCLQQYS
jgi:hypothetical protein